jgi:chemotaxis protein CheY-P-specific phosphatase CheC
MEDKTSQEMEAFVELLRVGFGAARESFSFMAAEQHAAGDLLHHFTNNDSSTWSSLSNNSEVYVLTTELKGDLKGKNYLIISAEKVNKMMQHYGYGTVSKIEDGTMGRAFLLEIGNIVAASSISHFANVTKKKIYGNVPALQIVDQPEKIQFFNELNRYAAEHVQLSNPFLSPDGKTQVICLWFFEKDLLNHIGTSMPAMVPSNM